MLDGLLTGSGNLTTTALSSLAGGTLGSGGNANFNGGVNITGPVTLNRVMNTASTSTLSDAGAVVSGTVTINSSGSFVLRNDGAITVDVSNSGSLTRSAGTSNTIASLTNSGVIHIQSGALTVAGLTTLSGGTLGGAGAFNASGGVNISGILTLDTVLNTAAQAHSAAPVRSPAQAQSTTAVASIFRTTVRSRSM